MRTQAFIDREILPTSFAAIEGTQEPPIPGTPEDSNSHRQHPESGGDIGPQPVDVEAERAPEGPHGSAQHSINTEFADATQIKASQDGRAEKSLQSLPVTVLPPETSKELRDGVPLALAASGIDKGVQSAESGPLSVDVSHLSRLAHVIAETNLRALGLLNNLSPDERRQAIASREAEILAQCQNPELAESGNFHLKRVGPSPYSKWTHHARPEQPSMSYTPSQRTHWHETKFKESEVRVKQSEPEPKLHNQSSGLFSKVWHFIKGAGSQLIEGTATQNVPNIREFLGARSFANFSCEPGILL
jgi:hypothetical protein